MEFGKKYSLLRVYFNRRSDFPSVWSIDDGDQKNEINVNRVLLWGCGSTVYTGGPVNKNSPVAWIEFHNHLLCEEDGWVKIDFGE